MADAPATATVAKLPEAGGSPGGSPDAAGGSPKAAGESASPAPAPAAQAGEAPTAAASVTPAAPPAAPPPPPPPPPPVDEEAPPAMAGAQPEPVAQVAPGSEKATAAVAEQQKRVSVAGDAESVKKDEKQKKEYLQAIKTVEEYVGENVVRGRMYLESKPRGDEPFSERRSPDMGGMGGMPGMQGMQEMGGYDRPPMGMSGYDRRMAGYDGPVGGYNAPITTGGYDRAMRAGGYDRLGGPVSGYSRPMDMDGYGRPTERGRYGGQMEMDYGRPVDPREYGGKPVDDRGYGVSPGGRGRRDYARPGESRDRERSRLRKGEDEYYYDEVGRTPSEGRVPIKKESEATARAELVIEKIRQDIEAFDRDENVGLESKEEKAEFGSKKGSERESRGRRKKESKSNRKDSDYSEGEEEGDDRKPRSTSRKSSPEGDYERKRGPTIFLRKTTDNWQDEPSPRRSHGRRLQRSHEEDTSEEYEDRKRTPSKARRSREETRRRRQDVYDDVEDDDYRQPLKHSSRDDSDEYAGRRSAPRRRRRDDDEYYDGRRSPMRSQVKSQEAINADYDKRTVRRATSKENMHEDDRRGGRQRVSTWKEEFEEEVEERYEAPGRGGRVSRREDRREEDDRALRRSAHGGTADVSRDRNYAAAGQLFKYESKPTLIAKGDAYRKEEVEPMPPKEEPPAPRKLSAGPLDPIDQENYQDFLLEARTGVGRGATERDDKRHMDRDQRRSPSADRYHEFLMGNSRGSPRVEIPVQRGGQVRIPDSNTYRNFRMGANMLTENQVASSPPPPSQRDELRNVASHDFLMGANFPRQRDEDQRRVASPSDYKEFAVEAKGGVGRVLKPIPPPPPETVKQYQTFTVQAKPTKNTQASREELQPQEGHAHPFTVQAVQKPPPEDPSHLFTVQAIPPSDSPIHPFTVQAMKRQPPEAPIHPFAVQAMTRQKGRGRDFRGARSQEALSGKGNVQGFILQAKSRGLPLEDYDALALQDGSPMAGRDFEHVEVTPNLRTEWWSRRAGDYEGGSGQPPLGRVSRTRITRGVVRRGSPRMVASPPTGQRRRGYEDDVEEDVMEYVSYDADRRPPSAYQMASMEVEGPPQQYVQMKVARRGRNQSKVLQMPRRVPSPSGQYAYDPYLTLPRQGSPEMLPAGPMDRRMQLHGVPMQTMPMQGVPIQAYSVQTTPMQDDRRYARVPMRMDRRLQQVLLQQERGMPQLAMQVERRYMQPMPIQAQRDRMDRRLFKYQVQQDRRQQQAAPDEGDQAAMNKGKKDPKLEPEPKSKDVYIETSKEPSIKRVVSEVEIQVVQDRKTKATSARVKTKVSEAATHDVGTMKAKEVQVEEEEDTLPHVSFTRDTDQGGPPGVGFLPPGYPYQYPGAGYPPPQYQLYQAQPFQAHAYQGQPYPPPAPAPPPVQPSASAHAAHEHHHHHHDQSKSGYKIAYLLPKGSEIKRDKSIQAHECYEDQEPIGAAVGVQCLSFYERFLNWFYPDTKATEDRSLMTEPEDVLEDKKKISARGSTTAGKTTVTSKEGKRATKGTKKNNADGKDLGKPEDLDREVEAEAAKNDKDQKPTTYRNSPDDPCEAKKENEAGQDKDEKKADNEAKCDKRDQKKTHDADSGKGAKEEKKDEEKSKKKSHIGPPIAVNLPWQGHEYEVEEKLLKDGSCVGSYRYKGMGGHPKPPPSIRSEPRDVRHHYREPQAQTPPRRSSPRREKAAEEEGKDRKSDFVPEVQIRLDFGEPPDSDTNRSGSNTSVNWHSPNMVVSYAHKGFEDKNYIGDDYEDDIMASGQTFCAHGSTKKLLKSSPRRFGGMPDKELLAYSVVVVVSVVALGLLMTMTGRRVQGMHGFGFDRHLIFNASKFKGIKRHVEDVHTKGGDFWNAAPTACTDAHCLTKGVSYLKVLGQEKIGACEDFYQYACHHRKAAKSAELTSHHTVEEGLLKVIKDKNNYPELMTARMLYQECINNGAIEDRGWDPLNEIQEDTGLGGWPFTDPVQRSLIWGAAARLLRQLNEPALLSVGVEVHPNKSKDHIISIGEPHLLLPPMAKNQSLKWYYGAVNKALFPFKEHLIAPLLAMEVSTFESSLASILQPSPTFVVKTLSSYPELKEFLAIALENITKVTPSTVLLIKSPQFVTQLLRLLKITSPHIVLNYLGFREVVVAAPFLPSKLRGLSTLGRPQLLRKHVCLRVVTESLPVMSLYASFNAFKEPLLNFKNANVTGAVRHFVTDLVSKMNWMDAVTKEKAKKKVSNSRFRVFHPRWISDKFKVFAQHENVPMVITEEGLRSYANIRKSRFENKLKRDRNHLDERWLGTVLDKQCSIDVRKRYIYAPVSFVNVSLPSQDNFLMVHIPLTGAKLAQCLMTLALEEGIRPDGKEDLYSRAVWSATSKSKYGGIEKCFFNQYSAHGSKNVTTPSRRGMLSIMGDAGAVTPSFKMYKQFLSQSKIDEKSFKTTLNLTTDQFFFVTYAMGFCEDDALHEGHLHSSISNHDRLNLALKNSLEFENAFHCSKKQPMNPAHKCRLWNV